MGNFFQMLRKAFTAWQEDDCLRLGASLAYYALFSLFPLLLLILSIIGAFWSGPEARASLLDLVPSGQARDAITTTLDNLQQNSAGAGLIGLLTLLLAASGVFGQLDQAFDQIWHVEPDTDTQLSWWQRALQFMRAKAVSFALVLGSALILLVSLLLSTFISVLGTYTPEILPGQEFLWRLVQLAASLALVTLVFALLYKFLPNTKVAWGDVWLGALISALLFTLLQQLIGIYLGTSNYQSYGAVGGVMALLVWIYFSSLVLLFGGEFTRVYAHERGSLQQQPAEARESSATA